MQPVPLNVHATDKSKPHDPKQPQERAMEAGREAELTATTLAVMCSVSLQKGDLNLQKK